MNEKIILRDLFERYMFENEDDLFYMWFDLNSNKNIDEKINMLEWCLKNNQLFMNYENYESLVENMPEEDIKWDIF